jgi:hypothetical protein
MDGLNWQFSLLLHTVLYVVYHLSLFESIPGGDSGELVAESCVLGVSHPPGYPLFTLLAHYVQYIPFPRIYFAAENSSFFQLQIDTSPSPAWRVNHLICVFGVLAALCIQLATINVIKLCIGDKHILLGSSIASILYALSPLVWEYSITSEVFGLNNFLVAFVIYITTLIYTNKLIHQMNSYGLVYLGAFLSALCLTNQHTSFLFLLVLVPAVFFLTIPMSNIYEACKYTCIVGLLFVIGLLPYSYLYFASITPKPGSWGDTSNIMGFFRHVLRMEYGTFQLGVKQGSETFFERVVLYFKFVNSETFYLGTIFLALAIVNTIMVLKEYISANNNRNDTNNKKIKDNNRIKREEVVPKTAVVPRKYQLMGVLLLVFSFYTLTWHGILSNLPLSSPMPYGVHARFWLQPNILICIFIGFGISFIQEKITKIIQITEGKLFEVFVIAVVLALVVNLRFPLMNKSNDGNMIQLFGQNILDSLPKNAILLSHTDLDWNSVRYLRDCEGKRRDVTHLSLQIMPYPWFHRQQNKFPTIKFPNTNFLGVSTDRMSEGNSILIDRFFAANAAANGTMYIVMQAINEMEIGNGGIWRDKYALIPWGTLYRVHFLPPPTVDTPPSDLMERLGLFHKDAYDQLLLMQATFPVLTDRINHKYPDGTWEYAAFSVHYDGYYQLALNFLTYGISLQNTIAKDNLYHKLPVLLDRLHIATSILTDTLPVVLKYNTLSSPLADLYKNTVVSYMKLIPLLNLMIEQDAIFNLLIEPGMAARIKPLLISNNTINELLRPTNIKEIIKTAYKITRNYVNAYPTNKDNDEIRKFMNKLLL